VAAAHALRGSEYSDPGEADTAREEGL